MNTCYTLPDGYTSLAYIQCTGEQYFDTGITANGSISYDATFVSTTPSYRWAAIFGARATWSSGRFDLCLGYNVSSVERGDTLIQYGHNTYSEYNSKRSMTGLTMRVVKDGSYFEINEEGIPRVIRTYPTGNGSGHLFVGANNQSGSAILFFYGRIIRLTFTGISDYVPAKRDSDGVAGFYDLIKETFHESATETPFVAGPVFNPGDEVIITKESNARLLAILYSKGYCAHEDYMTKGEAEAVKSLKQLLYNASSSAACPRSFDELRFFTGLTNKADSTAQLANWAQYLRELTFPPHLTALGNPVMGRANAAPRVIIGGKVTDVGDYFFYGCTNKSLPRICICKAIVPPTIKTNNSHPDYIDILYVPDESVTAYSEDSLWGQAQSILPISQCPPSYFKPRTKPYKDMTFSRRRVMVEEDPDYIKDGLIFWLDGERGNYPDKWVDQISGYAFENHGSTFIGNGRRFDGVDDYLTCALPDTVIPSGMAGKSIEVVLKVNQDVASKYGVVLFSGYATSAAFGWGSVSNLLLQTSSTLWAASKSNIEVGERTVITCVGNGTRALCNGVVVSDKDGYNNNFTNLNTLKKTPDGITYIGGYPDQSASFLDGEIYSIRIYNKNLSESEMKHNHAVDMRRFVHVKKYIHFEDYEVEQRCMAFSTDGKGLTMDNLAAVTDAQFAGVFNGNNISTALIAELNTFDEFQYFTGLTKLTNVAEFSNLYSLESIVIPPNITSMGSQCFRVTYSAQVTCDFTVKILRTASVISIGALTFNGRNNTNYNFTILVPNDLVESYKAANYWKNFADNIQGY